MMLVIDCDPFSPRPDVYAQHIYGTILGIELPNTISRCFGAWTWPEIEVTEEQEELIGTYLKDLYAHGCIRYAEW